MVGRLAGCALADSGEAELVATGNKRRQATAATNRIERRVRRGCLLVPMPKAIARGKFKGNRLLGRVVNQVQLVVTGELRRA